MSEKKENEEQRSDQEVVRREKLGQLARRGVDVFPSRFDKTHSVSDVVREFGPLSAEDLAQRSVAVAVPGRILSLRRMGRATFFHLSDSRTKVQAYIREDAVGPQAYETFGLFDLGDLVAVLGKLFRTKTGELTVQVERFVFLAKCLHPLPEKWHGLQDIELRFRQRYLDLIMNPEAGDVFRLRSAAIAAIRRFFDERGYVEVETPMMHAVPGGALARPFQTHHNALGMDLYLRIAPELYLKRLVVGGLEKVYEVNRNFRNEGVSSEHNPEFTMLEFYEAYADYHDMMALTEELITGLGRTLLGTEDLRFGEDVISLKRPWKRIKFMDALRELAGLTPGRLDDSRSVIELARELAPDTKSPSYAKSLDIIFDKQVKPKLVQPTFVINPPKEISPLAKSSPQNRAEAERFELIVGGMEIANAFSELTDPAEQRARFVEQAEAKASGYADAHAVDKDYIQALEYGLPPTGGEGIGIDRLVMLLANRKSIREVILFPLLRPR